MFDDARRGRRARCSLTVAVVAYPRISNLDEFQPLRERAGRAPALGAHAGRPGRRRLGDPARLQAHRQRPGLAARARAWRRRCRASPGQGGRVLGICGGLQMLGEALIDPQDIAGNMPGPRAAAARDAVRARQDGAAHRTWPSASWPRPGTPCPACRCTVTRSTPASTAQHAGMAAGRVALPAGLGWQNAAGQRAGRVPARPVRGARGAAGAVRRHGPDAGHRVRPPGGRRGGISSRACRASSLLAHL